MKSGAGVESVVQRLAHTVTFLVPFGEPVLTFGIYLETGQAVSPKEYLITLRGGTQDDTGRDLEFAPTAFSCSRSSVTKTAFQYAPPTTGGWVRLGTVKCSEPLTWLRLAPLRWDGPGTDPATVFSRVAVRPDQPALGRGEIMYLGRTER